MAIAGQQSFDDSRTSNNDIFKNNSSLSPQDLLNICQLEKGLALNEEKRLEAQVASSKQSLIYNLFMATLITATTFTSLSLPSPGNFYFIVFFPTVQKGLLSIFTMIGNFSTVRSVLFESWNFCP